MRRSRTLHRFSILAAGAAMTTTLLHPLTAAAQWSVVGSGSAAGAATTMPTGSTPTAAARTNNVLVSWAAVTLASGSPVAGYVVNRYDAINGSQATVGAGCSGVVATTSCIEQSVPSGTWIYTDTPVEASWTGGESSPSSQVSIP